MFGVPVFVNARAERANQHRMPRGFVACWAGHPKTTSGILLDEKPLSSAKVGATRQPTRNQNFVQSTSF